MNLARVRRWRREYREGLEEWRARVELTAGDWAGQKRRAKERMAEQDRLIEAGVGIRGRISQAMVMAGPLRTDEWLPSANVAGVGRRLGRLSAAEMEVE